jgi:hypothetical protein
MEMDFINNLGFFFGNFFLSYLLVNKIESKKVRIKKSTKIALHDMRIKKSAY